MDSSRDESKMTAGLDPGDKNSYLCLIDPSSVASFWSVVAHCSASNLCRLESVISAIRGLPYFGLFFSVSQATSSR
jgi:hypothetical protein